MSKPRARAIARMIGGPCDGYLRTVELDERGRPPLEIVVTDARRKPPQQHVHVLLTTGPELTYAPA